MEVGHYNRFIIAVETLVMTEMRMSFYLVGDLTLSVYSPHCAVYLLPGSVVSTWSLHGLPWLGWDTQAMVPSIVLSHQATGLTGF